MLRATTAAALPGSVLGSRSRPMSPIREEMTEPTGPKPRPPVPPCPPLAPPCKGQMGSRGLEWWGTGHQWQRGIPGVPIPKVGLPYTLVDPLPPAPPPFTQVLGVLRVVAGACVCLGRAGAPPLPSVLSQGQSRGHLTCPGRPPDVAPGALVTVLGSATRQPFHSIWV